MTRLRPFRHPAVGTGRLPRRSEMGQRPRAELHSQLLARLAGGTAELLEVALQRLRNAHRAARLFPLDLQAPRVRACDAQVARLTLGADRNRGPVLRHAQGDTLPAD